MKKYITILLLVFVTGCAGYPLPGFEPGGPFSDNPKEDQFCPDGALECALKGLEAMLDSL